MRELSASADEPAPRDPPAPPGYRALRALGGGGMGLVWLCERALGDGVTQCAVVKRPRVDDAASRARFADEVRALAALGHGCVVRLLDAGVDAAGPWLAVEHVDGVDGAALVDAAGAAMARDPAAGLTVEEVAWVVHEAARGLSAAHEREGAILHRDVSPQNVLLSAAGEVKLADFGIARAAARASRTTTGVVVGNLRYMAPEQLEGRATTARTDVYGLGRVLDELLSVLAPGADASAAAALRALADEATRRAPDERPESAATMRRRVRAAVPRWADGADALGARVRALTAEGERMRSAFAGLLGLGDDDEPAPARPSVTHVAAPREAPAPPPRPRARALVAASVALAALSVIVVGYRLRPRPAVVVPAPAVTAPTRSAPSERASAAPPPVEESAPPAALAVVEPPRPRASPRGGPHRAAEVVDAGRAASGTATLRVSSLPFARVSIDGAPPVGTPRAFTLPEGEHELRARFEGADGREAVRTVRLRAGETRTIGLTPE